ncbi:MAG: 1-deoxy-D-xylulose-5-phosphate reductoisomerase [Nitriliruptoraceae bacterium]
MSRRRVVVLGSTGSIGRQALEVIARHGDRFEVVAMAAGRDDERLEAQADAIGARRVALDDVDAARRLAQRRPDLEVLDGPGGVVELAETDADVVLNGITGAAGLASTLAALAGHTTVALANKESLIVGGPLVLDAARAAGGIDLRLVPVDSEHSAIAQCLRSGDRDEVERLVLTASGGPFRGRTREDLEQVSAADALAHPTWAMGPMITVNSATLMNKGLELIEAHLLFDVDWASLDVVVHPQSIVHSMVEFVDGSTVAQLSPPDMRVPIQLALSWPERLSEAPVRCDWTVAQSLTFEPVDRTTFRALDVAEAAGRRGGTFPAVMNAANEQAVGAFLEGQIRFPRIVETVEATMEAWASTSPGDPRDLDDVLHADRWARHHAREHLGDQPSRPDEKVNP